MAQYTQRPQPPNREPPPLPKRPGGPQKRPAEPPRPPKPPEEHRPPRREPAGGLSLSGIFNMLGLGGGKMDSDRILIMGILLLLSGEDSDELLMLALLYILL